MYPPVFLIHTCDIIQVRSTGETDSFGNRVTTETTVEDVRCRFTGISGSAKEYGYVTTAKEYGYVTTAKCTVSGRTDVYADDMIVTSAKGMAKKYWVNVVRQIYEPTTERISHTIFELRETQERVKNGS